MAAPLDVNNLRLPIKIGLCSILAADPTQEEREAIIEFLRDGGRMQFITNSTTLDNVQADPEQPEETIGVEGRDGGATPGCSISPIPTESESVKAFVETWCTSHGVSRSAVAQGDLSSTSDEQQPCAKNDNATHAQPGQANACKKSAAGQRPTSDGRAAPTASRAKKSDLLPVEVKPEQTAFIDNLIPGLRPTDPRVSFERPYAREWPPFVSPKNARKRI